MAFLVQRLLNVNIEKNLVLISVGVEQGHILTWGPSNPLASLKYATLDKILV